MGGMSYKGEDKDLSKLLNLAYESVKSKQSFVEMLQEHVSIAARCTIGSDFGHGFQFCLDKFRPDVAIWQAKLYSSLGSIEYYVQDRVAFEATLKGEIEKVRNPEKLQSPKVLAKMVAVRVSRVRETAHEVQNLLDQEKLSLMNQLEHSKHSKAKFELEQPGKDHQWDAQIKVLEDRLVPMDALKTRFVIPDLRTVTRESFSAWLQDLIKTLGSRYVIKAYVELDNFLARPDVTEEMLRMACDMILVAEIMES